MSQPYFYTALLDVLSYRFRLERDIKTGTFLFKDDLEKSLSIFDKINAAIFNVQAISDTIIITTKSHDDFPEFIHILKQVFLKFLETGLFIRGGVSYSKHFQAGKITYSHAVARAYEIESKLAIYPRIVIDDNIIQMYSGVSNTLPKILNTGIFAQQNGVTFIDVVDKQNWADTYANAKKIYMSDRYSIRGNESAFQKHQWFEQYVLQSRFAQQNASKYIDPIILV